MIVSVPATSANLGPGFDTLGLALDFRNEFEIVPSSFTSIQIRGEGENNPKLRADNIFVSIFSDFYYHLTERRDHFRFTFHNKIPISRGLGSSSAIIIGAIGAAYAITGMPLPKEQLLNLALKYESHPDNIAPAALGGFTVSMIDRGKVITRQTTVPDEVQAVMVIPSRSMSTHHSRMALPKRYSRKDAVYNVSRCSMLTLAFFNREWDLLRQASRDRLHQEYRMKNMPILFDIQKISLEAGSLMSTLSGSGSSVFSLVHRGETERVVEHLRKRFNKMRIEVMDFDNEGFRVDDSKSDAPHSSDQTEGGEKNVKKP